MKIKTHILTVLILTLTLQVSAQQTFQWGIQAGGQGMDAVNDIVSLGDHTFLTGSFTGEFASGNEETTGKAKRDIYLMKLDKNGNSKWIRSLSGEGINRAYCLAIHGKTLWMGGTLSETVCQDKQRFEGKGEAVFIAAWSDKGKAERLTRLPYSGHATFDVLEVGPDGMMLAGGLLHGTLHAGAHKLTTPRAKRAWWITLSADGEPLTAHLSTGEGSHRLVSASIDREGNRLLLFSISGNFGIEPGKTTVVPQTMNSGLVLVKTDATGVTQWTKSFHCTGYFEGIKAKSDPHGNIMLCTNFNKKLTVQDTLLTTTAQLETALMVLDADGNVQQVKTLTSPVKVRALDMHLTRPGNILLAGYFRQSYGTDGQLFHADIPKVSGDLFLCQLDPEGELVWHDEPGSEASGFCQAFTLDQTGNIILTGGFTGRLLLGDETLTASGHEDILVAKYFNCLQKEVQVTGNDPLCEGGEIRLAASGDFKTYLWNDEAWSGNSYTVTRPGTYHVTAFDKQGCAAADTVVVKKASIPQSLLPADTLLRPGESLLLTLSPLFTSCTWEDGSQSNEREIVYLPGQDKISLSIEAETFAGCLAADTMTVHFQHPGGTFSGGNTFLQTWPNPVGKKLFWSAKTSRRRDIMVTLTDIKNVPLFSMKLKGYYPGTRQSIEMSRMAAGNYLLSISIDEIVYTQKIVKK